MANVCRIEGDVFVAGELSSRTMGIPSATVVNADVAAAADIAASKLEHQYVKHYSQESGTVSADKNYTIHCVHGATGSIVAFEAGSATVCAGAATIAVDLVNWRAATSASVLTAAITLNSSKTAYAAVSATIDTAAIQDGDVLEVQVDETAGGGTTGKGVYASAIIREDAA